MFALFSYIWVSPALILRQQNNKHAGFLLLLRAARKL
jgi:hypothetical protein